MWVNTHSWFIFVKKKSMIPAKMCEIRSVLGNGLVTNFLPKNPSSCTLPEGGEEIPDYGSMKSQGYFRLAWLKFNLHLRPDF